MSEPVKFVPFQVFVDPAFWAEVSRRRLDEWQLDEPTVNLVASYGICSFFTLYLSSIYYCRLDGKKTNDCTLIIGHDALDATTSSNRDVHAYGKLFLCNTLKDFKAFDLKKILAEETETVWKHITSPGSIYTPTFTKFYLVAFAVSS